MRTDPSAQRAAANPLGRRPGESGTREAIATAARRHFAEHGYDRTTLRGIARDAGVDPALITHFYGSKQALFAAVVELPVEPGVVLPAVIAGDPAGLGERLATFVVGLLESEARPRFVGLIRAAATEPEAAEAVRDLISTRVFAPMADALGLADAELRANLIGAQVVGLVIARYVVRVEPIASLAPERVVAAIAPTLQRYLAERL